RKRSSRTGMPKRACVDGRSAPACVLRIEVIDVSQRCVRRVAPGTERRILEPGEPGEALYGFQRKRAMLRHLVPSEHQNTLVTQAIVALMKCPLAGRRVVQAPAKNPVAQDQVEVRIRKMPIEVLQRVDDVMYRSELSTPRLDLDGPVFA